MTIDEVEAVARPLVDKNGSSLLVTCPTNVGDMHADQTKVRPTRFNLLSNAARFTERGTITLRVGCQDVGEADISAAERSGVGCVVAPCPS